MSRPKAEPPSARSWARSRSRATSPAQPLLLDGHALLDHVLHQVGMLVGEVRTHGIQVCIHERLEEEGIARLARLGHAGGRLPTTDRLLARPISEKLVAPSVATDKVF